MTRTALAAAALTLLAAPLAANPLGSVNSNIGEIFIAADTGMTLYTFTEDSPNTSTCYDACASAWPPFLAPSGAYASGALSIIERNDGSRQWALAGQPLYFWQGDAARGDVTGHGVGGVWFAAQN